MRSFLGPLLLILLSAGVGLGIGNALGRDQAAQQPFTLSCTLGSAEEITCSGVLPSPSPGPSPSSTPTASPSATPSPRPSPSPSATSSPADSYPWHTAIVSTTFWVGEEYQPGAADGSQACSTYDSQWAYHFSGGVNLGPEQNAGCTGSPVGGCDGIAQGQTVATFACTTERRTAANGYFPTRMTPHENPFYLDLPFDDLNNATAFAERCRVIPWAHQLDPTGAHCSDRSYSYMKNRWVAITGPNGATCYGQIEDAGPDHYAAAGYVFGTTDPRPPADSQTNNAGLDVSPALNGCLGFHDLDGDSDRVSWRFVDSADVPPGPWTRIITSSPPTP